MSTGDIEHKELPDDLLHEPKGASTAAAGTVYVADGAGSGSFKKLPISSLDIAIPSVTVDTLTDVDSTISLVGQGLSQTATGVLTDVSAFVGIPQEITNKINQNASEFVRVRNNQKTINDKVVENLNKLELQINEIITALKSIGLLDE